MPRNYYQKLLDAIENDDSDLVKKYVKKGADLKKENANKKTPIQLAGSLGHWKCVRTIAETKNTDAQDKARFGSVLLKAVKANRLDQVKYLLNAHTSLTWHTVADKNGCLHWAVKNNNPQMIALLIKSGADITKVNKNNQTPIQLAYSLHRWECIAAITKSKHTDKEDKARYGSVLLKAVKANHLDTVRCLLNANAPINWYTNADKNGCLHWAVKNNNPQMIALLLSFGASTIKENKNKLTPELLAKSLGLTDSWNKGISIYKHHAATVQAMAVLIQAKRQPDNPFYALPFEMIDEILNHLGRYPWDTLKNTMDKLIEISANCFINNYSSGFFHRRPKQSKELVSHLKDILDNRTDNKKAFKINEATSEFLEKQCKSKKKDDRAISLLEKFHLHP